MSLCLVVMVAGCSKAAPPPPPPPQDPNIPESFTLSRICKDGSKIYVLTGGDASGKFARWESGGNGSWEVITDGITLDQVCSIN